MANIRSLKKDIDYLLSLVLEECMYVADTYDNVDKEKVYSIANSVIQKHRELRVRVNHPDGKDNRKLMKASMKDVVNELYETANKSLDELAAIIQSKMN
jgi:hypothetical protein